MVRLLVVSAKYPPYSGGAAQVFSLIAENLAKIYKDDVYVLTSTVSNDHKNYADVVGGVPVTRLFPYFTKKWKKIIFLPLSAIAVLGYFLKNSRKFDVVETHTVGEICLLSQIMAKIFRKRLVKHVIDMHTSTRLLKWPRADRYVNCGSVITDKMVAAGIPRTAIYEANLPIAIAENKGYNKNASGARIFLFVGELSKQKGINDLLYVMRYLPKSADKDDDIEMHIVGDGPLQNEVMQASREDSRIHYHGQLDHDRVINMMKHSDVLVHPTYDDVMPLSILEAMMMGNAIITRDVGEIKKNVNGAGIFVRNKEQLLQAMQKVTERDPVEQKTKSLRQFSDYVDDNAYEANHRAVMF